MSVYYDELKWPEIRDLKEKNPVILVPIGMTEQHGPHLPISTDVVIATETARLVAERLQESISIKVLRTIWSSYNTTAVSQWPGTIRLQQETLIKVVYEICASLCQEGFKKIVIVNSHGQNPASLEVVCRKITDDYNIAPILTYVMKMIGKQGADIRTSQIGGAAGHACEIETSLMLALRDDLVDMTKAVDETTQYRNKFVETDLYPENEKVPGVFWTSWNIHKPKHGLLGNAKHASKQKGEKFIKLIVDNYVELIEEYYKMP